MSSSAVDNSNVQEALAAIRLPLVVPPMPAAGLRLRLTTSPWLRSLFPTRLAVLIARSRGKALWRSSRPTREQALATMEAIVGGTERESEAAALARARVIEQEIERTLFWQPWTMARLDDQSEANVRLALGAGRGVLVSSSHLGPIFLHLSAITSRKRAFIVSAPWWFEDPTPDYWGRRLAHWWKRVERRDDRSVCSVGAYPVLRELLREGELVVVYFDMPGSRPTRMLGKQVMLASGSARLACETDSLVLPVRSRREGHISWTDVAAPLDPRQFSSHEELHDALAAVHERFILELPATLEDPNRAGAWAGGATAAGWTPPPRSAEAATAATREGERLPAG